MQGISFPAQFSEWEKFAAWSIPTQQERTQKRIHSSIEEINTLHGAVSPRIDEALDYLNQFPLDSMPADAGALFNLILSVAEIGPYAEWFGGDSESPITRGLTGRVEILSEPS